MITAPVLRMNLAFFHCMHRLVANHHIVKPPSLVFLTALVANIPKSVLNLPGIELSKRVCKSHSRKVREALPFGRCEARHRFVSLRVVDVDVLVRNIEVSSQHYRFAFPF